MCKKTKKKKLRKLTKGLRFHAVMVCPVNNTGHALPWDMLPGSLRVFAVWAQRIKFLFNLHLIRGACVLRQESQHPLLGQRHQGVVGLRWSGGSSGGGLEFQRGHPAVLQRLGQDLLDGLIIRPVWNLSAFTNRGFKSPVGRQINIVKMAGVCSSSWNISHTCLYWKDMLVIFILISSLKRCSPVRWKNLWDIFS